jgi:ABC-type multidrug transport system ATPase subunit
MKALGGRLSASNGAALEGEVFYDGDNIKSGKFLPPKISTYIEQGDTLEAAMTVEETLKFAWQCVSGGHHGYDRAKDAAAMELLNKDDGNFVLIGNILKVLGLSGVKDTYVGNGMIRGVSGGQKRRVTVGEMIAVTRPIAFMDSVWMPQQLLILCDLCVRSTRLWERRYSSPSYR